MGNRSATPLPAGASGACGMRGWRCCACGCAPKREGEFSLSVAIIDIQSVKTISKGGSAGMTQAKRSKARRLAYDGFIACVTPAFALNTF